MPCHSLAARIAAVALCLLSTAIAQQEPLRYAVAPLNGCGDATAIPLQVTIAIDAPGQRTVLRMPTWTPGSYRHRDFPERIADVT